MPAYYPPLDSLTLKNLLIVKRLAEQSPEYLLESPYGADVIELFAGVTSHSPTQETHEPIDVIKELEWTYNELKTYKPDKTDSSATMAFIRNASGLLEKLLQNIERAKGVKQTSDFYREVIKLLDELATPSQRTEFQERLAHWAQE